MEVVPRGLVQRVLLHPSGHPERRPHRERRLAQAAVACALDTICGDPWRQFGTLTEAGSTLNWLNEARNKKSLVLDLRKPKGVEIAKRLRHRLGAVFGQRLRGHRAAFFRGGVVADRIGL